MLTRAQQRTLEYIQQFIKDHGFSPTAAEIADGIGIKSRGVVHRYLTALQDAKKIKLIPKRHRNIVLNLGNHTTQERQRSHESSGFSIPLLGSIAAGRPIEAIQQQEQVNVHDIFSGPHRYALNVKGDSMIEEGIFDGDTIICQHSQHADNGQIVVALVDNEEATLKRIEYNPDGTVTLYPANANYKPMVFEAERVKVQGIYIGLVRVSH